jgi:hypothetical protein
VFPNLWHKGKKGGPKNHSSPKRKENQALGGWGRKKEDDDQVWDLPDWGEPENPQDFPNVKVEEGDPNIGKVDSLRTLKKKQGLVPG